jgi:hypothetical protein
MCSRYLAAHDAAARLRASLREEHMLGLDLASTIYKHVSRFSRWVKARWQGRGNSGIRPGSRPDRESGSRTDSGAVSRAGGSA